jgi:hypothetical protein
MLTNIYPFCANPADPEPLFTDSKFEFCSKSVTLRNWTKIQYARDGVRRSRIQIGRFSGGTQSGLVRMLYLDDRCRDHRPAGSRTFEHPSDRSQRDVVIEFEEIINSF